MHFLYLPFFTVEMAITSLQQTKQSGFLLQHCQLPIVYGRCCYIIISMNVD